MAREDRQTFSDNVLPSWVPQDVRNYIEHINLGAPIRQLARLRSCHASTISRQVTRLESRRDDPLVDEVLRQLGRRVERVIRCRRKKGIKLNMSNVQTIDQLVPDDETVEREAKRILRRMCEPSACLAVALNMDKAVIVRDVADGKTIRTAVTDAPIVQAMALKGWIDATTNGKISRYTITNGGRAALKAMLAEDQTTSGFAEAPANFDTEETRPHEATKKGAKKFTRYASAESPIAAMARRKRRDGTPFLTAELVGAAERLREDFELAQMEKLTTVQWEAVLGDAPIDEVSKYNRANEGVQRARRLVVNALRDLGPGLADVVLRVCCFLEGLEAAEKRMGWSARSGKIVLRIALQRLVRHYAENKQDLLIG